MEAHIGGVGKREGRGGGLSTGKKGGKGGNRLTAFGFWLAGTSDFRQSTRDSRRQRWPNKRRS